MTQNDTFPLRQKVDLSDGIQFPGWCTGVAMNIIHNCLDKWITGEYAHKDALIWEGEEVIAFCVLKAKYEINEVLRGQLLDLIMAHFGKVLKPKEIKFIKSLSKTRNAKVMHRIIRATYLGNDPGDLSSLEDVTAVDDIRNAK